MNDKQLAELKRIKGILSAVTGLEDDDQEYIEDARKALQSIISQDALDKMAENARELGLDYEPAPVQEPSFKEWTQDYVRNNIHKLKSTPPAAQPAVQEPVAFVAPNGDLRKTTEAKDASEWGAKFTPLYTAKPAVQPAVQTWPVSQDPATQLQVAQIIAMRDSTPPEAQPGVKEG
jgi:hypothetical protein